MDHLSKNLLAVLHYLKTLKIWIKNIVTSLYQHFNSDGEIILII
jgi:hypothetical protein